MTGWLKIERAVRAPRKRKRSDPLSEYAEQVKFVDWLKKNGIRVSGSGAGVNLALAQAVKLKRMGVAKGYPDIFVPLPLNNYHGFYIEMKKVRGGSPTIEQIEWIKYLQQHDYFADFAFGFEDAKNQFIRYSSGHIALNKFS